MVVLSKVALTSLVGEVVELQISWFSGPLSQMTVCGRVRLVEGSLRRIWIGEVCFNPDAEVTQKERDGEVSYKLFIDNEGA